MSYVLLTPIKDEAEYLEQLMKTVLAQTTRPILWVIVDGNSKDGSYEKASELLKVHDWIIVKKQEVTYGEGIGFQNFSQAINEAYNIARRVLLQRRLDYEYVGKLDATVVLPVNYFETLVAEMKSDPRLAIVCGAEHLAMAAKGLIPRPSAGRILAFTDIRLYRRTFFDEMGGYPLTHSSDTVLLIKATNRHWHVLVSPKTYFDESRLGGSKIGVWKGYKLKGEMAYRLDNHPLLVLLSSVYSFVVFPPHYQGLAILYGYLLSTVRRLEKVDDEEIKEHCRSERLKEVFGELRRGPVKGGSH